MERNLRFESGVMSYNYAVIVVSIYRSRETATLVGRRMITPIVFCHPSTVSTFNDLSRNIVLCIFTSESTGLWSLLYHHQLEGERVCGAVDWLWGWPLMTTSDELDETRADIKVGRHKRRQHAPTQGRKSCFITRDAASIIESMAQSLRAHKACI